MKILALFAATIVSMMLVVPTVAQAGTFSSGCSQQFLAQA